MPDFPTTPGSLIYATACDDPHPAPYMLVVHDDETASTWINPHLPDEPYRQDELTLVQVVHDEGRAQMLADLPAWGDLTDRDKGAALQHAWKVDQEGGDYARENYPAEFHDHPILTQLTPTEACVYVDSIGIDMGDGDGILIGAADESLSWDEFERLTRLA